MPTVKEQDHKELISISDGRKLGEVKGLYLDKDATEIAAIYLGKEGLIHRKSLAVDEDHIQMYGIDVLLVAGSDIVSDPKYIPDSPTFLLASDFWGREIETDGGTKIGTVDDIILDQDAKVSGFVLGKISVEGPIAERKAVARGAVTSLGSKDSPIIVEFEKAEELPVFEM
jgi:sporulation protein YlmC with PRC-barrel domain